VDDPFYVSANGSIHHSSADAFGDVEAGPVQVVLGWEAATRYAREMARIADKSERASTAMQVDP
jgi:hypothetical protein